MKKTLLITTDYLPDTGGIVIYWSELAKHFPQDKFLILAPISNESIPSNIIRTNFFINWIWPHWVLLLIKLPKIISQHDIKLIIAAQILPIGTICYFLRKIRLIKEYQVSCHGMDLALLRGRKKRLAKSILNLASKVIVNSDFTKGLVYDFGVPEKRVYKIRPCPHKLLPAKISVPNKYNIDTDRVILSVARLVERKGIAEIIIAMPQVWQIIPEAVYLIVGDGPDRDRLNWIFKENIKTKDRGKIIFCGRVPDNELSAYYQTANIFIMTTRKIEGDIEGFGMVYLEAGLFNLPVIASPVGGVGEAVKEGETGIFVNSKNSDEISAAIIKLLKDDEFRIKLGNNNYNWAKSFNWSEEAKKLFEQLK